MSLTLRFRRRAAGGAAGAPSSLRTAEPAYNMADRRLYIGFGDDGSGNATSIRAFAADDFVANVPSGGSTGQALVKNSNTDGDWVWATVTAGGTYTASGDGIELTGTNFSLNYAEIDTGLTLTTRLAGKANTAHTHAASDITSGVFAASLIPNLDASKITSGVFDPARIPVLSANKTITSSSNIASLTAPQQADIVEGTVVVTTDGRRWVYSGTGSKTLEASYIELADITPDWAVVANKPAFATVATSGSYNDLSNRPTLGTMASQNAASVAITGGSITGVILDGGTF